MTTGWSRCCSASPVRDRGRGGRDAASTLDQLIEHIPLTGFISHFADRSLDLLQCQMMYGAGGGDDVLFQHQAAHVVRTVVEGKLADLQALARRRLSRLGITQIYGNDGTPSWCTVTQTSRFFSHRRDRVSGRFAACIWLG